MTVGVAINGKSVKFDGVAPIAPVATNEVLKKERKKSDGKHAMSGCRNKLICCLVREQFVLTETNLCVNRKRCNTKYNATNTDLALCIIAVPRRVKCRIRATFPTD